MSKRAAFYLIVGVICAVAALLIARERLAAKAKQTQETVFTRILVAVDDIEFAMGLTLKEGDQEGNVKFVKWPEEIALDGAITDAEKFKQRDVVAAARLVLHQPVLERLIADRQDFVKPGMYPEMLTVDRRLLSTWKPGTKVDIFRVSKNQAEKFIQCAQIYAVGELPPEKLASRTAPKPKSELPPNVFVLLPTEFKKAVIETRLHSILELSLADRDCGDAPELVPLDLPDVREIVAEELRRGEAELYSGQPDVALGILESIATEYTLTPSEAKKAGDMVVTCKKLLAEKVYQEAEAAFAQEQYERCRELCISIRKDYRDATKIVPQAVALEARASGMIKAQGRELEYKAVCQKLHEAFKSGDLPEADRILKEKLEAQFEGYEPPAYLESPNEIVTEYRAEIRKAQRTLDGMKRLFDHYMNEGNEDKALEKFNEIKEDFPAHPFVEQAQEQLRQKGFLD